MCWVHTTDIAPCREVPQTHLLCFHLKTFACAAPSAWSTFPEGIHVPHALASFRSLLRCCLLSKVSPPRVTAAPRMAPDLRRSMCFSCVVSLHSTHLSQTITQWVLCRLPAPLPRPSAAGGDVELCLVGPQSVPEPTAVAVWVTWKPGHRQT